MKKNLILILTAWTVLVSCGKQVLTPEPNPGETKPITFNLTASHPDDTKAVKTAWETGDAIFVFFDNVSAPKYLKMSYNGTSWTAAEYDGENVSPGALGLTEGQTGTMVAVFLPFGSQLTVSASGDNFKFSETQYSYYLKGTLAYTVENNTISGAFSMAVPDGFVQFFINDASAENGVAKLCEAHVYPTYIKSISTSGEIVTGELLGGKPLPGYVYDKQGKKGDETKGFLFSGVLKGGAPGNKTNYNFVRIIRQVQERATVSEKTLNATGTTGRAVNITALAWDGVFRMVDLGLPSGTLWANLNLGAIDYYDYYGGYYAWGETESRTGSFTYSNYKWGDGSNAYNNLTKYIIDDGTTYARSTDGKTRLEPGDDAASVVLGTQYSTPTAEDWTELVNNCTFTWTYIACVSPDLSQISSTCYGYRITGTNSNSIFLPAAGRRKNKLIGTPGNTNCPCYYWSSTICMTPLATQNHSNEACCFEGNGSFSKDDAITTEERIYGLSIRPVQH